MDIDIFYWLIRLDLEIIAVVEMFLVTD